MYRSLGLGFFAIGLLCVRSALAYDAFNNYGPGDTYDTTTGYSIAGDEIEAPLFLPQHTVGSRFTAEASGILAVIRISFHDLFLTGFNQVDVRLHEADAAGDLGPIMAAFTRGGLPPAGGADPPETISSFDPDVVLTSGNMYWIVVAPGDSTTEAVWNWSSSGAGDRLVESFDGGLTYAYREARRGAMRIEVISIPEPATFGMLAIAVAFLALGRRRK
jgi:hypothetical protein